MSYFREVETVSQRRSGSNSTYQSSLKSKNTEEKKTLNAMENILQHLENKEQ